MRHVGTIAVALFLIACGPDPNAKLPYVGAPVGSGGSIGGGLGGVTGSGGSIVTGTGGATGSGGSIATGSGGNNSPFGVGGASPFGSGGSTATGNGGNSPFGVGGSGSGGSIPGGSGGTGGGDGGSSGIGTGGSAGAGGIDAAGGVAGTGGVASTGGDTGIDGGGGDEPCVPAKTISGSGNSGSFGTTGAFCFRTPDNISGWDCSNFTGRTLKVNGVTTTCAAKSLPAKVNGYYYFDASAGGVDYASIYWF